MITVRSRHTPRLPGCLLLIEVPAPSFEIPWKHGFPARTAVERPRLHGLRSRLALPRGDRRRRIRCTGGRDRGCIQRRTRHMRPARAAGLRALRGPHPASLVIRFAVVRLKPRRKGRRGRRRREGKPQTWNQWERFMVARIEQGLSLDLVANPVKSGHWSEFVCTL